MFRLTRNRQTILIVLLVLICIGLLVSLKDLNSKAGVQDPETDEAENEDGSLAEDSNPLQDYEEEFKIYGELAEREVSGSSLLLKFDYYSLNKGNLRHLQISSPRK